MSRLRQLPDATLDDDKADTARREAILAIRELQGLPAAGLVVKQNVTLANGVATPVAHGLGRVPLFVRESCVRGALSAGVVVETRDGAYPRDRYVTLTASGYGATVTVDLVLL
jgi:hypothetical protein